MTGPATQSPGAGERVDERVDALRKMHAAPATSPFVLLVAPAAGLMFTFVTFLLSGTKALPAVALPAGALLAGMLVAWPAIQDATGQPERFAKTLVLVTIQETSVLFGFVIGFLAFPQDGPALESTWPLWVIGSAGALTVLVQAAMLRIGVVEASSSQESFGRFLVKYILVEVIVVAGFIVAFLQLQDGPTA